MTKEHTTLEKYTSHNLFEWVAKGLCVRDEFETEQTATYWPQVPLIIAALLSHSAELLKRGSWEPKPSAGSWFSLPRTATRTPTAPDSNSEPVCGTDYIIVWHPPASCERRICTEFNPSTVKVIPWYLRADAPVIWLTTGSKVNMLQGELISDSVDSTNN